MWGWGGGPHRRGLRGLAMMMLSRGPKNGAELIEEVDRFTHGHWRPSPGSVYPLLDALVVEGVVQKRADGRYEVSARGRSEFRQFRGWMSAPRTPDEVVAEIAGYVSYLEDLATSDPRGEWKAHREKLHGLAERLEKIAQ